MKYAQINAHAGMFFGKKKSRVRSLKIQYLLKNLLNITTVHM